MPKIWQKHEERWYCLICLEFIFCLIPDFGYNLTRH